MSRRAIKRGPGKQWVEGKSLRVADEVPTFRKRPPIMPAVLSAWVSWSYFLRRQAMLGCST
jgi:hypothetical protein